jgi:hypothetical protein
VAASVGFYEAHVLRAQAAQSTPAKSATAPAQKSDAMPKGGAKMTDAQMITSAMSAGPSEVTKGAAIMAMSPDGDMSKPPRQVRAGTNGWVCFPKTTATQAEDPMCLDKTWMGWVDAYMKKAPPPKGTAIGIGYMLRGDAGASNINPYDMAPSATNQWVVSPSHVMLLLPDPKLLDAYPTDPTNGGPWVMWKGTPYAHVMVPVSQTKAAAMSMK